MLLQTEKFFKEQKTEIFNDLERGILCRPTIGYISGEKILYLKVQRVKVWNVKGINLGGNKGGKLILTDKQLVFQPYVFNIGTRLDKIPLENITGTAKTFNPLVPNPNMIKVETRLGEKFEFTFWKKIRRNGLK